MLVYHIPKLLVSILLWYCLYLYQYVCICIYSYMNFISCWKLSLQFWVWYICLDENFRVHRLLIHISYHCIHTIVSISLYQCEFQMFVLLSIYVWISYDFIFIIVSIKLYQYEFQMLIFPPSRIFAAFLFFTAESAAILSSAIATIFQMEIKCQIQFFFIGQKFKYQILNIKYYIGV